MNRRILNPVLFMLCMILSGCTVGPDYERPEIEGAEGSYVFDGGDVLDGNDFRFTRWWETFADPVTSELVEYALENNFSLKAAAARVIQSEAIYKINYGQTLPQVDYEFFYERGKRSFNFNGGRFSNLSTTFQQQISASYVLDIFGKLKRAKRAAWDELLSSKASQLAVMHGLIANVVNGRIRVATLQRRVQIANANIESRQKTLDIVERRYRLGLVGPVDVRLARENLQASKSQRYQVMLTLVIAQNALDVLLGKKPASGGELAETLPDLPELEPVPLGVPAGLLDRRPDLLANEFVLMAASERIGVSVAGLYPDLTLTGNYGRAADKFEDIFIDETEIYSAVLGITQPIFAGGAIRGEIDRTKGVFEELAADYAQSVLEAIREVEDSLASEQLLSERLGHVEQRYEEAQAAKQLSLERYSRGVENILTVLESERRARIAEEELAIIKGDIWSARVDLLLALGGDWIEK